MRITPACAGKSKMVYDCINEHKDHPRVCGEKFSKSTRKRSGIGSPPRVRGKVLSIPAAGGFAGITPACAGKRKYSIRLYELIWDHPRVCGEKLELSARA